MLSLLCPETYLVATTSASMELCWFRPALGLSAQYVTVKCESKLCASSGQEMRGLEIKTDGHCLRAGGGGKEMPCGECWALGTLKPSGLWWSAMLLPCL